MTDRNAPHDSNEPPQDLAQLTEEARRAEATRTQQLARLKELAAQQAVQEARSAQAQAARYAHPTRQAVPAWQQPFFDRFAPSASPPPVSPPSAFPQAFQPAAAPQQIAPAREEKSMFPATAPWTPAPESRELQARPAWLADRPEPAGQPAAQPAAQATARQAPADTADTSETADTIQGSRDRLTSRWFALKGLFADAPPPPPETPPAPLTARPPVLAVFSLAGGVGKTSLVATLGRALSARGERVLLIDTTPFGLLPFFFGAHDQRPGQLRTFSPPAASGDAPIQMVAIDPEDLGPENAAQEALTGEISKYARGLSRILVDVATASGSTTRRILKLSPMVLVPLVPDMNSVVSIGSIDAFFEHNAGSAGRPLLPYYILNQFDRSMPLHLDVREVLRGQLGERLLPFALRRAPVVSEALAEGMTVVDYAPNSTAAEDILSLAGWVKSQSAPATSTYRGVRWSER